MSAVLRAILPAEVEQIPTGFETVGHIAHFNLRECHLPYKNLIGRSCCTQTTQKMIYLKLYYYTVLPGKTFSLVDICELQFIHDLQSLFTNVCVP